jgi:hypothetical protein
LFIAIRAAAAAASSMTAASTSASASTASRSSGLRAAIADAIATPQRCAAESELCSITDGYAAPSVSWPGRQLQGQSSSLCSASSTRTASSTLRPTERSVALT